MLSSLLSTLLATTWATVATGQVTTARVASPSGDVELLLASDPDAGPPRPALKYRVNYRGKPVIVDSALGLDLEGQPPLPSNLKQVSAEAASTDETYRVPAGKSNPIRNQYNSARVDFVEAGGAVRRLSIEVRAYDDGVAFRYVLPAQASLGQVQIMRERTEFRFAKDATVYPLILRNFTTSYEDEYQKRLLGGLHPEWLIGLPLLVEVPGVAWAAIAEAHIEDYAGMYLRRASDSNALLTELAPRRDRPTLAVIRKTPLSSPWRVLMVGSEPGRLVESNILLNLNPPSAISDTSWIVPGKTSWNWWSGSVAEGVAFKPGMNTETMEHYIDFSADSGFPYMLIDAGWARRGGPGVPNDLTTTSPAIDMPAILRHAKEKGVKIWLWAHWTAVERQLEEAFPLFEQWGIAGVKIDFMDRDDQEMVAFYHRVLKTAAKHHLMIDFHGAYKPDGIERTYPNLLTREGVMGLEYMKWSARVTPEHNCTLPFTRMLAGSMDYTPGGFENATREEFVSRGARPMVLGTRAHQLALFVVFESHLQMVSDYPERYKGEKDFEFIRRVPASWEETCVLAGRPMESISIARRSGDEWFIGCLTNWDPRDLELSLGFLGEGKHVAEIYADAADADTHPKRTVIRREDVERTSKLKLHLAPGGGAAIRIRPSGS
jgi:alpha-glucosidase